MNGALRASRSRYFPREYDKIRTVKLILGAISLVITDLLLIHSVREFITFRFIVAREINELSYIVFIFAVAAIFYALILVLRKIYKLGYVFKLSVNYNDVDRKYIDLSSSPTQMVFNESNNRLYIATIYSIIVLDDTINKIVNEIAIKNTGYHQYTN